MEYITSLQAADKWNLSKRQVNALCKSGQIYGAVKKSTALDDTGGCNF